MSKRFGTCLNTFNRIVKYAILNDVALRCSCYIVLQRALDIYEPPKVSVMSLLLPLPPRNLKSRCGLEEKWQWKCVRFRTMQVT